MSEFRKALVCPGEGRDTYGITLAVGLCCSLDGMWETGGGFQPDLPALVVMFETFVFFPQSATVIWIPSTSCNEGVEMDIEGCVSDGEPKQL